MWGLIIPDVRSCSGISLWELDCPLVFLGGALVLQSPMSVRCNSRFRCSELVGLQSRRGRATAAHLEEGRRKRVPLVAAPSRSRAL